MVAITICSDFGAPKNKVWYCFHCFPIYFPWSDGTGCHDLCFLNVFYGTTHLPLNISVFICVCVCVCVCGRWMGAAFRFKIFTQYSSFNDIPSSSVCIRPFSFYCIFPVFILLSISVSLMVIFLFYISVLTFLYFSRIDLSQCFPTQSCCCTHRK